MKMAQQFFEDRLMKVNSVVIGVVRTGMFHRKINAITGIPD
jgi:hypothetical protein